MQEKKQNYFRVMMQAMDLCHYIMTMTKSPDLKNEFTFMARLQDFCLDAIKHIDRAADIFAGNYEKFQQRLNFQREALAEFRMLVYFAKMALEQEAMSPKQYERISKQSEYCIDLIGAWILSDERLLYSKIAHA